MRTPAKAMLCSKLAIATALVVGATPAAAQSLQGGYSAVGATVDQSVAGLTTVNVTNSQAVINWTATGSSSGGLTNFQDSGTSAIFQSASDFAVLNKVAPTIAGDGIYMNGAISSIVGDFTGGTVYFYSPNGIVIGKDASINVGSLGLTTLPIADDGNGNWMSGFGTSTPQVVFGQATNAASYIRTDTVIDGSINANGFGSYVALVAPRVEHRGIIRTDGAAALVGVAGATITFNTSNLYDIQVTTGSSDDAGVVVDGGTIERNSQAIGGDRRAYLVAVPANNAMTMLIEGGANLGFDIAGSAGVENNVVVLSAGRNIFGGDAVGPPNTPASLSIDNATFTSNVEAHAVDSVMISSSAGATSFSGSLDTSGGTLIDIRATNNALSIGTTLNADASNVGANAVGGDIVLAAQNGNTLSVGSHATLLANGYGFAAIFSGFNAGHGTGGDVLVQAAGGGALAIGGRLIAHADGIGGNHGFSNGAAGDGTGGRVRVLANDGGSTVTVALRTDLTADGVGGTANSCQTCSISGGDGVGGLVDVNGAVDADGAAGTDNSLTFGGRLLMTAQGIGGAGDAAAGSGQGGEAYLSSADGAVINVNNQMLIFADGIGGNHLGSGIAGSGIGGTAGVGSFWGPGGQININSGITLAHVTAEGFGGNAILSGGQGGYAEGGVAFVDAPGAQVTVTGNLYVSAYAKAGNATGGTGGAAVGGVSAVIAQGPSLLVTNNLQQRAEGLGGSGLVGGAARGGVIELHADNGALLTVNGNSLLQAFGLGGDGETGIGGTGGDGEGGGVSIVSDHAGSLTLYALDVDARGEGGEGRVGGGGLGGDAFVSTANSGAIRVNYQAIISAEGEGGTGYGGNGGAGEGGQVDFVANTGSLRVDDLLQLWAHGSGGDSYGALSVGGLGDGGTIYAAAENGGTLTMLSTFLANAVGGGGGGFDNSSTSGDGIGGNVTLRATGANSTVDAQYLVSLDASGWGGATSSECEACGGGGGGDGIGGSVRLLTDGGLGNRILLGDDLQLSALGQGASGFGGDGGDGTGGDAFVDLDDDGLVDIAGNLALSAQGSGGYHYNGGIAGNGTGGDARITLGGTALSLISVGGTTNLDSDGYGGGTGAVLGGAAGSGTGGWSRIYGVGGTGEFHGTVTITAEGEGGDSDGGAGGAGLGGRARLNADGATYHLFADADLDASSSGGYGAVGGSAASLVFAGEDNAIMIANNGGAILVEGNSTVSANATGGNGINGGSGGSAIAGAAGVIVNGSAAGNGSIELADVNVTADATGGDGDTEVGSLTGGAGGNATGGRAELYIFNSNSGTNSLVVGTALVTAIAEGGDGGIGGDDINGWAGGDGGFGNGGTVYALAGAGNGSLTATTLDLLAYARGGAGGRGGYGTDGTGGDGGMGGHGDGGTVIAGITSGAVTATTGGTVDIGALLAFTDSYGGNGGDGGFGAVGTGVGGDGGDALTSLTELIARGGTVTIGTANLVVDAIAGNGGIGIPDGQDGDSFTPDVLVIVTNRLGDLSARATLDVGTMNIHSIANPSTGVNTGQTIARGGHQLLVENSDAHFGTYTASVVAGDGIFAGSDPSRIRVLNGSVDVTNGFDMTTAGNLSVHLDNGTLDAASVGLHAANFVDDDDLGAPLATGTISAGSFSLLSGDDMIIEANLDSGGPLLIDVPGNVVIGNIDAVGRMEIYSGGGINLGNLDSQTWIDVGAVGAIDVGSVDSDDFADLISSGSSVNVGDINALGQIDLGAATTIDALAISGGGAVNILSGGSANIASVLASGPIYGDSGSNFTSGAMTGRSITLFADGTVTTGNLTSTLFGISVDAIGTVDLDDITSADFFFADTDVNLKTGNLNLTGDAVIDVGGNIKTGTINAGGVDFLAGGNIEIGDADVTRWLDVEALGSLLAGNIIAGDEINLSANLSLVADNLSVGIINPSTGAVGFESNVGVISETSVQLGNVEALGWVGIASLGTLSAASIASGNDVLLAADGNISVPGGIMTGADSRLLIVGVETLLLGEGATEEDDFDRSLVFAAVDQGSAVPTGGSVTVGPITGGRVEIFAGQNANVGTTIAGNKVLIEAGGALTAANITSGHAIELVADGALSTGNLSAGIVNPFPDAEQYSVGLRSRTSIQTGTIASADFVGMASGGTIQAGTIVAGGDVVALAAGSATFGGITTGGGSRLLIAGFGMLDNAGGYDNPDSALLFQAADFGQAIATGGSVTVNGPISTSRLDIFAGSNATVAALNLGGSGRIDAGGLLTLNGDIDNIVTLISNDINVAAGVTVSEAQLVSRNSLGTFVGDALGGTGGYRLSNAEYGRFGELDIIADTALGAGSTMTIGDLTVANAGGREWDFAVYNGNNGPAGTIRVVGDMLFTGMGGEAGGVVDFTSRRFELDAGTGSISLEDGSGGLGGTLEIDAQHVAVAEDFILDQLASDPGYAELAHDLATPTETASPNGVIRAGEILIYLNDGAQGPQAVGPAATPTYSVYVQNTGTSATRAGFLTNYTEIFTPEGTPPGAIDLIVNGQLIAEGGTLTGADVRDLLVEEEDVARFSSTSTINGCALSGPCIIRQDPPPIEPTPDIASQITLIGAPTSDDQPFGNEEAIEDNEEDGGEDSASSPIQPPAPLFNTKPLEQPGDTDEPVSGGGNPALIGNGANPVDDGEVEEDK